MVLADHWEMDEDMYVLFWTTTAGAEARRTVPALGGDRHHPGEFGEGTGGLRSLGNRRSAAAWYRVTPRVACKGGPTLHPQRWLCII